MVCAHKLITAPGHAPPLSLDFASRNNYLLAPPKLALPLTFFGTAILYLFLADRTSVFLKEQKQYSVVTFGVLIAASLAVGTITGVKRDKDMGFLNREQTDEWKGWMQSEYLAWYRVRRGELGDADLGWVVG